jgi:hypothetical protein
VSILRAALTGLESFDAHGMDHPEDMSEKMMAQSSSLVLFTSHSCDFDFQPAPFLCLLPLSIMTCVSPLFASSFRLVLLLYFLLSQLAFSSGGRSALSS